MKVGSHIMSFGALLRHHRLAARFTQEELADRAGISVRSVSDIERGISRAPQKATVRSLAEALLLTGGDLEAFEAAARASRRMIDSALHREIAPNVAPEGVAQTDTGPQPPRSVAWRFRLKRPVWMVIGLAAVLTFPLALTLSRASPVGSPATSTFEPWGWTSASLRTWVGRQVPSAAPTQFDHSSNVAVDTQGNVYVADALADSITKLSPDGRALARWGAPGKGRAQFDFPTGLAIDHQGDIYVADTNNDRIQKLSPSGRWLAWWGMPGSPLAHISGPTGVAVDARGNVYIANGNSAQIVKLSPTGTLLARWSPRVFRNPEALAVSGNGTLYVADAEAGLIVRLSPGGRLLSIWHFPGFVPGQYAYPTGYPFGVAVDGNNAVYVTDSYRNRVLNLSPSGQVQAMWGGPGSEPGEFDVPIGIAVDRYGHVYVGDRNNHRVQKFTQMGIPLPAWGASPPRASTFDAPRAMTTDRFSNVYILEGTDTPRVQELSQQGLPIREVVLQPSHGGNVLSGLAVDNAGDIYVADAVHNRIDMFWPTGKLRMVWGTAGIGGGQFHDPTDVALDRWGTVYVADSDNQRVQIFSQGGTVVEQVYTAGYPQSVAIDSRNRLSVADPVRHEVEQHSASGRLLAVWGQGAPDGLQLHEPIAVAVDGSGNAYVADAGNRRIVELSATGHLVGAWGGQGMFAHLEDVAVDRGGNVYALDGGARHVLKLNVSIR